MNIIIFVLTFNYEYRNSIVMKSEINKVNKMITEAQIEEVIIAWYEWFLTSGKYDEFKKDYDCSYNEPVNQALMFDEYVRSDSELQDWFWDEAEGEGLSDDELKKARAIASERTDIICKLHERTNFPGLFANRRAA